MPFHTLSAEPGGLFINCVIGASPSRANLLKAEGRVPPSIPAFRGLIDTGSTNTCVDRQIIRKLRIPLSGTARLKTASTEAKSHVCGLYDVTLTLMIGDHPHSFAIPVLECDFAGHGVSAVLGRDVLSNMHLVINGPSGFFTIGI